MTVDFNTRMKEAEAAMLMRRNRQRTTREPHRATEVRLAEENDTSLIDMLKLSAMISEHDRKLRHDMNEVIENALATVRKHEINLKINDEPVGKLEGLTHSQLDDLIRAASVRDHRGNRKNIMIKGPMGGGKSTAAKQVADLFGLQYDYIGQTEMPHDVIGYVHPVTGDYKWTPFTRIYVEGGVIVLEEMDAWSARATLVTNIPLANGYITLPDGTRHQRHPDCIIVACTNTWGTGATAEYVGRNKLDAAYLDRFAIKLDWKYDNKLERAAARNDEVVDAVQRARFNATHYGIKVAISPRSSIDIADMVRAGYSIMSAMEVNFLSGVDHDTRRKLMEDVDV